MSSGLRGSVRNFEKEVSDLGNTLASLLPVAASGTSVGATAPIGQTSRRTASAGLRFGDVLNAKTDSSVSPNALAQIAALVANGTPISKIAAQLATDIARSVPSNSTDAVATSRLAKILTAALSPPGQGPPIATTAAQVAALARRLTMIVTAVAREADSTGQQNDLSGKLLDADSAKETPAQLKAAPLSNGIDVGALVDSLLAQVAAQLQPGSSLLVPTSASAGAGAATSIASRPTLRASQQDDPTAGSDPHATNDASAVSSTPSASSAASASDLLGRMIARAASVDAQLNGGNPAPGVRPAGGTTLTPAAMFARLVQTVAQASQSSGGSASQFAWDQLHRFDKPGVTAKATVSNTAVVQGDASVTSTTTDRTSADKAPAGATSPNYDPDAVLSQVVRGLSIRTGDGSQEIRLNLQPENLGDVSLKLTINGSSVSATVVAQNADVASTLSANQHQLARAFADAGLRLTGFSVDVSGGNTPGSPQQRDSTQGFGRRFVIHEATNGQDETDLDAVPTFGPPSAAPNAGLLNQLA